MDCKPPVTILPCEIPNTTPECPLGTITTNCIYYEGEDNGITGVNKGELLTLSMEKLTDFVNSNNLDSISSNTIHVVKTPNANGKLFSLEVRVSTDANNQLTFGSDGWLYAMPFTGETFIDTNTINFTRMPDKKIKAEVRYVQSPTVNLTHTPSGLKADVTNALMQRITLLESKVQVLENNI